MSELRQGVIQTRFWIADFGFKKSNLSKMKISEQK